MTTDPLIPFLTALHNIRGAGRFCAQGSIPFVPPGIVLKNDDDLALPLSRVQAAELRGLAEPAPYGMGAETRLDESVRKSWQIDASELRWTSKKWQSTLDTLGREVAAELGVEGRVTAEPYKLLLYDEGGFFLPHRDTEKAPGMFGTLILNLPARHCGGALVIRHQGREARVDFGAEFDASEIRWAAFFADCEHEVLPVASGHRLCLACNLILAEAKSGTIPSAPAEASEALVEGLQHLARTRGADLTAILLEHRYTQESLRVAALKGDDRARAAALFAAAEKTGLTARLALVSLYQMGQLEEDYGRDYDRYRKRNGRRDADDATGEMGEIYEETLTIEHWRTPEDRTQKLGRFAITEKQLLSLARLGEGDPDEKFAEGYTGNAGCTMEHWYRRAAIAVWPQEAGPALLARYDFGAACEHFASLAEKNARQALPHGHALIHEARKQFREASEWQAGSLALEIRPLLRGIGELRDASLYEKMADTDFIDAFALADREVWAALLRGFGAKPLDFFQAHAPLDNHGFSWFCALDALLGHDPTVLAQRADLPCRLVTARILPERAHHMDDPPVVQAAYRAHLLLAASCVVQTKAERRKLQSWLLHGDQPDLPHLRGVLAPALLEKTHGAWLKKDHSLAPAVLATAISFLAAEVARPIQPYPDQRRPAPAETSNDPLIHALLQFMADPQAARHEIRRAQVERVGVEAYVKRHELDLDLHTRRQGSPHTLVCEKNDHSYHRALKQRGADETLLHQLRELKLG
jgi:hypothetical protein